jgi:hypothetical protein
MFTRYIDDKGIEQYNCEEVQIESPSSLYPPISKIDKLKNSIACSTNQKNDANLKLISFQVQHFAGKSCEEMIKIAYKICRLDETIKWCDTLLEYNQKELQTQLETSNVNQSDVIEAVS